MSSNSEDETVQKTNSEESNEKDTSSNPGSHGKIVAAHYNEMKEKGLDQRYKSPILYLRNFNNWIKSVLIIEYVTELKAKNYCTPIRVLDMCCGKGGDIMKWQNQRVKHITFVDIADVVVEQCQTRYENGCKKFYEPPFTAEFIVADCTKENLRKKYKDPSLTFDIVSCQFGLHYSFESLPQACRMFSNISECLRPGGFFIGTIPDANEIVSRAKKSENNSFGNRIYNIKLMFDPKEEGYPLFGAKYDFQLEGVVNCPEFLVNFDLCQKIAAQYGLELVYKGRFEDFFEKFKGNKALMHKHICFETYPAPEGENLIGKVFEYEHARRHLDDKAKNPSKGCIGTMSFCEWEAATIYMAFAFKKKKNTWDLNGKPVYE